MTSKANLGNSSRLRSVGMNRGGLSHWTGWRGSSRRAHRVPTTVVLVWSRIRWTARWSHRGISWDTVWDFMGWENMGHLWTSWARIRQIRITFWPILLFFIELGTCFVEQGKNMACG